MEGIGKKIVIAAPNPWTQKLVKEFIDKNKNLSVFMVLERDELTYKALENFAPDFVFFPHWSWYIPEEIYENFVCIVFHPSDLPFGRGGTPIQNLIALGHTDTMISAIKVVSKLDAGEVYMKKPLSLQGGGEEILLRMQQIIFDEMIPEIIKKNISPIPQEGNITTFKRRTPQMSEISQEISLPRLFDTIRMLDIEGYPKAFIRFGDLKLIFSRPSFKVDGIYADVKIIKEDSYGNK